MGTQTISRPRSYSYTMVWEVATLKWVEMTQPSAGAGGGGDASAANQVTGNASLASIDGKLTNPLPVSGTFYPATQPVSGPLTDTQLRATAVPVSGTVTATGPLTDTQLRATAVPISGALTDTQLRATPVPISGTVTASGPLTDAQLRATAVPVSGTVSTGGLTDTQLRATAVPVSGTVTASGPVTDTQLRASAVPVTANAGTNLNTSLLATEAGNLASIKARTDNIPPVGQAAAAASTPVVLPATQITTLTPPAAITGFGLEATQLLQATAGKQDTAQASLTTIAALSKAEDAAHSDGDTGIFALTVRQDDPSIVSTTAAGDYQALKTDSTGRLYVTNSPADDQSVPLQRLAHKLLLTQIQLTQAAASFPQGFQVPAELPAFLIGG